MHFQWPKHVQARFRVCHPMNTGGSTWLAESDLVFVRKHPIAVLKWSPGKEGQVPDVWLELNPKMLKHDASDPVHYRYEGEINDPRLTSGRH
jgi:hypothetical protein